MASRSAAVGFAFAVRLKSTLVYSASSSSDRIMRGAPRRIISAGTARALLIAEFLSVRVRRLFRFGSRGSLPHAAMQGNGRRLVEENRGRNLEALAQAGNV